MSQALKQLYQLKGLSLKNTDISKRGLIKIANSIKNSKNLEYFRFARDTLSDNDICEIQKILPYAALKENE